MKSTHLFLHLFLILNIAGIAYKSLAQNTFNLLISSSMHEVITHSAEDNEGNFYLTGWKTDLYSPETCGWIIKLKNNGELIDEVDFCSPDSAFILNDLILDDDTLFVFGSKGLVSEGLKLFIKIAFDENLNILNSVDGNMMPGYYIDSFNPLMNEKKHFILCGSAVRVDNSQDLDIFFYEVARNFDSIKCTVDQRDYIQTYVDFLEDTINCKYKIFGVGTYENTTPGYSELIDYDTLFNFIKVDSVPWHLQNQFTAKWLNENSYILGGKKSIYNPNRVDLGIIKLNREDEMLSLNHFGMGGDTINYPALNSLGLTDNLKIYYGGTSNISNTINPFPDENSWLILNYLDTNLNLIWQEFYGGDAFYHMIGLQATYDGGCLMYSERYDENIQFEEYDVYILKVDSLGLMTSTSDDLTIPVNQLSIVPNPANHYVSIRYPDIFGNEEKEIIIYNSIGIPVMGFDATQEVSGISADISELPAGLYFVVLRVNGKKAGTGKLIVTHP